MKFLDDTFWIAISLIFTFFCYPILTANITLTQYITIEEVIQNQRSCQITTNFLAIYADHQEDICIDSQKGDKYEISYISGEKIIFFQKIQ